MNLKILFKENFLEEELFQQTGYKPEQEPFSLERSDSEVSQHQCFVMHQRWTKALQSLTLQPCIAGGCSASGEPSSRLKPLTLKFEMFETSLDTGPTVWLY